MKLIMIIPDELKKVKIGRLRLSGRINGTETHRIRKMFPDTQLIINSKNFNFIQIKGN